MEQAPDRKRVQEFARGLFGHYTSGMLTLMVDIGHKIGLFEAAAAPPPVTRDRDQRLCPLLALDRRRVFTGGRSR